MASSPIEAPIPWWIRIVVALGAVLNAIGAIVALVAPQMLVSPQDEINGAVHIYAGSLASRNIVLAIALLLLLALGFRRALANLMLLVGFIQLVDVIMDCVERRWMVAPGVLVLGVLFLVGAAQLSGYPFWKAKAWK